MRKQAIISDSTYISTHAQPFSERFMCDESRRLFWRRGSIFFLLMIHFSNITYVIIINYNN